MHTQNSLPRGRQVAQVVGAFALLLLAGCASYDQQTAQLNTATKTGNAGNAVTEIDKQVAANAGKKDELIFRLEQGATMWTAAMSDPTSVPDIRPAPAPVKKGEAPPPPQPEPTPEEVHKFYLNRSINAFDLAEDRVNKYEEEAKVKVGAEVGAALTNQATLPYRGRTYDKVMMNTYKAIGYLELGDKDKARVELNRSLQRQRDAVAANEKRIAALQDEQAKAARGELKDEQGKSASYDTNRAMKDGRAGPALDAALSASLAPMKAYGDYVNPYSVFLDGLFFTVLGEGGSDLERGRKSFERVAGMVPENTFIRADLEAATAAAEGKAPEGVTYVIFETGTAAARDQVRIDIPTFLVNSRVPYVGAAFPKLKFNESYIPSLGVTAGDKTVSTSIVASMDSVIANDFKNEWPAIVTKTMITTATKAIVAAVAQKAAEDRGGMWAGLAAGLIMGAINSATNIADTRSWSTLPKEFQYARVATPANREITINAGGTQKTVALAPGAVNVVYVKSASPTAPLLVSSFVLK
ncbi:MAG TPA: hypothetical protein VF388_00700 [Lacunisphaera sp.]